LYDAQIRQQYFVRMQQIIDRLQIAEHLLRPVVLAQSLQSGKSTIVVSNSTLRFNLMPQTALDLLLGLPDELIVPRVLRAALKVKKTSVVRTD
jgi:hypothetical protein